MNRYLAILFALLICSLPQFASAASVRFGAGLDPDGGHCSGSASDTGSGTRLTGKMHWSGTTVTFDNGWVNGTVGATLLGTVTRTNDPALEGASVQVSCFGSGLVLVQVDTGDSILSFSGMGHATIK